MRAKYLPLSAIIVVAGLGAREKESKQIHNISGMLQYIKEKKMQGKALDSVDKEDREGLFDKIIFE